MSGDVNQSPHPVIEVRKWDESGVLGRHLSVLAVRVAYALAGFANRETGLAWPSLKTLGGIVQVHRDTLRRALNEIKKRGIPLEHTKKRKTGQRSSGHAFAGPVIWAIVPFDEAVAATLLRQPTRRKRRIGVSESLQDAHSEGSDSLVDVAQRVRRVGHDLSMITRKNKSTSRE